MGAISQGVKVGAAPWAQSIDEQTDLREAITLARGTSVTAIKIHADLLPPSPPKRTANASWCGRARRSST